jgi:hypothetical protein
MEFINTTNIIGQALNLGTINITGDLGLTMLMIFIIIIAVTMALRIPVLFAMVMITPILFVLMAFVNIFLAIGGLILMVIAGAIAKYVFELF